MLQNLLSTVATGVAIVYSLFVAFKRERSVMTYSLSAALLATAALEALDLLSVLYPDSFFFWKKMALAAESLLPLTWLLFSLTFSRRDELKSIPPVQRGLIAFSPLFLIAAAVLPVGEFFQSPDFNEEKMLFLGNTGFVFYLGILIYMILSLIHLENILLTVARTARWKIKFEILGAGALIAALIFYYSQGLLYRSINMNLRPVRSFVMVTAVILMAYSWARRSKGSRVYVSRQAAYRSVVIFIIGLYLLGLGLIGEGMRYFGGSAQKVMLVSLTFISGICLAVILLSETVKRKIKVLLHKHFYRNKYDYRVQWLQFTDRLSSSRTGEELMRTIVSSFCDTFGMGGGALFLHDEGRGIYSPAVLFEMDPVDRVFAEDNSLVLYMRTTRRVFSIKDEDRGIMEENRGFLMRCGISFAVPLHANGEVEGFIAMGRPINRKETYTYEDYDLMKTFAQHASSAILNLRLSEELANAREMEAVGRVSSFVVHDLKNLVSTVSMIVDNAEEYRGDPAFRKDMFQSLGSTVDKMKRLIAKLRNLEEKRSLRRETADLRWLVYDTAGMITSGEVKISDARSVFARIDTEEIQKVILNMLLNAIEATGGRGTVFIEVGGEDAAFVRIRDNGCGMSEEFRRKHLFKPFRTTKEKGLGIGLYQCKQIIEAHEGWIEVSSEAGKGSVFTFYLPSVKEAGYAVR